MKGAPTLVGHTITSMVSLIRGFTQESGSGMVPASHVPLPGWVHLYPGQWTPQTGLGPPPCHPAHWDLQTA